MGFLWGDSKEEENKETVVVSGQANVNLGEVHDQVQYLLLGFIFLFLVLLLVVFCCSCCFYFFRRSVRQKRKMECRFRELEARVGK